MLYLPLFTMEETIPDFRNSGYAGKNTPVFCDFSGTAKDCLSGVQKQLIDSMNNDIYPFSQISHEFDIKADAMVIYQGDNFALTPLAGNMHRRSLSA